jgi:glycosyltransferase involved in cell wall biosynthesis
LLHGYFSGWKVKLVIAIEKFLAGKTDHLIAIGNEVKNDLLAVGVGKSSQYSVFFPGLPEPSTADKASLRKELELDPAAIYCTFVGRLTQIKRPDRLLDIATQMVQRGVAVNFLVAGEGELFDECKERVILSNGFSKAFAMTGWRLGSLIMPSEVAERTMLLLQTTSSCVSPFLQRAGIEAITGEQNAVNNMMMEYKSRRDLLVNGLNQIPGISCHLPGGAFYAFPNIASFGMSSEAFADHILNEAGIAILPGSCFGQQGEGFVRLVYASSRENITKAISRLAAVCKKI